MSDTSQLDLFLEKGKGKYQGKVCLKYSLQDQNFSNEERYLELSEIEDLVNDAEENYYKFHSSDVVKVGIQLYNWLDGDDRFLESLIQECPTDRLLVLAFQGSEELLHLPWETLHNGNTFLLRQFQPEIVPVRLYKGRRSPRPPQKRALEVVFMATSPKNIRPELNFEAEEMRILESTKSLPLNLEVEESGSLSELKLLLNQLGEKSVDVVHISGHATNKPEPYFMTEDDFGDLHKAGVNDFDMTFKNHRPSLLFLSGCQTGGATDKGTVPSLAGKLVQKSFPAILAWAKPVRDTTATFAASSIYQSLSQGLSLAKTLHIALNALLTEARHFPDWHLLRLYVNGDVPGKFIEAGTYKKRVRTSSQKFLDPVEKTVRVASREEFIGRRRTLQNCLRILRKEDNKYGVIIQGMGGLGKSSIAARLVDRLRRFYQPVILVGELNREKILDKLRDNVGQVARQYINDNYDEELSFLLSEVFKLYSEEALESKGRLLLVFDDFEQNFESNEDGSPKLRGDKAVLTPEVTSIFKDVIKSLQAYDEDDACPKLIITTRYYFGQREVDSLEHIPLTRFSDSEWNRFQSLKNVQKIKDKEIRNRCLNVADGNPRLLEWLLEVVDQMWENESEDYTKQKIDTLIDLLESKEQEFRENVFAEYLLSLQDEESQRILACLHCFEVPIPVEVIEAYTGITNCTAKLSALSNLSLVDTFLEAFQSNIRHYRLSVIIKKIHTSPQEQEYKLAATILSDAWSEKITEELQLTELTRLAIEGKNKEVIEEFGVSLIKYLYDQQRYREVVFWGNNILHIVPDHPSVLLALGRSLQILGEVNEAIELFVQAEKVSPNEKFKSILFNEIASIYLQRGEVDKSLGMYEEALAIDIKTGDEQGKSATLHEMAYIYQQRGEVDKSLGMYEEALAIKERIGDKQGKSATLHSMAYIYRLRGEVGKSLGMYEEALAIDIKIGDEKGKSSTLHSIASIYLQRGEVDKSLGMYEEALAIKERIGDEKGKSATLHEMAYIYRLRGEVDKSLGMYKEALAIDIKIGDEQSKSATLHEMAYIYQQRGEVDKSLGMYEEALAIKERIGDEQGKSATLHSIAYIYQQRGEVDKSLGMNEEALAIKERIGDEKGKSAILHSMAYIYRQRGEVDKSLEMYEEALAIKERIGDEKGKSSTLHSMAYIYQQRGEVDKSLGMYEEALAIKERIGDEQGKSSTLHEMAYIYRQRGEIDKSLGMYEEALVIKERIGDLYGRANTAGMMAQLHMSEYQNHNKAWDLIKLSFSIHSQLKSQELKIVGKYMMLILNEKVKNELNAEKYLQFKNMLKQGEDVFEWLTKEGIKL